MEASGLVFIAIAEMFGLFHLRHPEVKYPMRRSQFGSRPHREIFPVATPSRDFTVDDTSAPFVYRIPEARDARTERERV